MVVISRNIKQSVIVREHGGAESILKITVIELDEQAVLLGVDILSDESLENATMHEPVYIVHRRTPTMRHEPATTTSQDRWNEENGDSNAPEFDHEFDHEVAPETTRSFP